MTLAENVESIYQDLRRYYDELKHPDIDIYAVDKDKNKYPIIKDTILFGLQDHNRERYWSDADQLEYAYKDEEDQKTALAYLLLRAELQDIKKRLMSNNELTIDFNYQLAMSFKVINAEDDEKYYGIAPCIEVVAQ